MKVPRTDRTFLQAGCPTWPVEAILAKSSLGKAPEMDALPIDGVCACALAFGTLLSSQVTDAHLQRTLVLLGGNPTNLPDDLGEVKLLG